MNALYTLDTKNVDYLKEKLALKFKKIEILQINFNESEFLKSQKEYILKLINTFDDMTQDSDFIIVIAPQNSGVVGKIELSLKLAKNLNCPIFEDEILEKVKAINPNSKLVITDDLSEILSLKQNIITPLKFEYQLRKEAKRLKKHIILPEGDDDRILMAAHNVLQDECVKISIIADKQSIKNKEYTLGIDLKNANIIEINSSDLLVKFADEIYELRKQKGISKEQALNMASDRNYFATMMVKNNLADAVVSGAVGTTADTIRPALQLIKTKPNTSVVSGLFFMVLDEELLVYADCAININPDANMLADIAITSAKTALSFGLDPHVAMLSYSTADSGSGQSVEMIKQAKQIATDLDKTLKIVAPIQYDAAVDKVVASKKMPSSDVAGSANVFVFPDLNSANICYKAVQRSANALAIGPILQGLKKPVNDLSRGALTQDIINTILISAIQAGGDE
ncbi:phosphate acetyltransferase [Campylobacter mucosalis]|uniref:phosphate acetyltransferase n=1 Tax=Campylobacter mucosalis TaxID=202 RepID=UPI00147065CE